MAWYIFDRCPKEVLPQIEALAKEIGLAEVEAVKGYRLWLGDVFKREDGLERALIVRYSELTKDPFMLETPGKASHKQDDVRAVIKRFIDVCRPTCIKRAVTKYNMAEFN